MWSRTAVATISTTSVRQVPKKLMAVKNVRRHSTLHASVR